MSENQTLFVWIWDLTYTEVSEIQTLLSEFLTLNKSVWKPNTFCLDLRHYIYRSVWNPNTFVWISDSFLTKQATTLIEANIIFWRQKYLYVLTKEMYKKLNVFGTSKGASSLMLYTTLALPLLLYLWRAFLLDFLFSLAMELFEALLTSLSLKLLSAWNKRVASSINKIIKNFFTKHDSL